MTQRNKDYWELVLMGTPDILPIGELYVSVNDRSAFLSRFKLTSSDDVGSVLTITYFFSSGSDVSKNQKTILFSSRMIYLKW